MAQMSLNQQHSQKKFPLGVRHTIYAYLPLADKVRVSQVSRDERKQLLNSAIAREGSNTKVELRQKMWRKNARSHTTSEVPVIAIAVARPLDRRSDVREGMVS